MLHIVIRRVNLLRSNNNQIDAIIPKTRTVILFYSETKAWQFTIRKKWWKITRKVPS